MKNLKVTGKVQVILITMVVIIIGAIIVTKISNDRLIGYTGTELGETGTAKPSELFDETGTNADGLHIGDFVNYDAGKWTQDEIDAIKTGEMGNEVTANGSTELPSEVYQFGGFEAGSSRNGNVIPSDDSYNYIKDASTGNAITGWRVFDIEGDTVTLISAGNPEAYNARKI